MYSLTRALYRLVVNVPFITSSIFNWYKYSSTAALFTHRFTVLSNTDQVIAVRQDNIYNFVPLCDRQRIFI